MGRLGVALAILLVTSASAQGESEADLERARTLFEEARVDFDAGRFPAARIKLEESLRLAPRTGTAMNLARTLRSLGEPLRAEEVLEGMLEGEYGDLPQDRAEAARALTVEVRAEAVSVRVRFSGRERASLEIDGQRVGEIASRAIERRLNPGTHRVVVVGDDGARDVEEVTLAPGESIEVALHLEAARADTTDDATDEPPRRGWIWAIVGIVVAGAAATAVGVVLTRDPRVSDSVFPRAEVPTR